MNRNPHSLIDEKMLIIFDCDGVLFHSEDANLAYFEKCLHETLNMSLSGDLREKATYMSVKQLFMEIEPDMKKVEELYSRSQEIPYDPYLPLIKPAFNFEKTLLPLKEKKYLAVATNRAKSLVKLFKYFNLFEYFHYKVSAYSSAPKPAPDMLFECCDYFDVETGDSVFIGDSLSDQKAADSAGIAYISIGKNSEVPFVETPAGLFK